MEPLNACCFIREDIANFNPQRRYITGSKLIERWAKYPDIQPEAFIRAKIRESRLIDAHPIMGLTQGSNPGEPSSPPLEDALFWIDQIEEVELNDFSDDVPDITHVNGASMDQERIEVESLPEPTGGDSLTPIIWRICNRRHQESQSMRPCLVMKELKEIKDPVIVGVIAGGIKFETHGGDEKELTLDTLRARINEWRKRKQ